MKGPNNLLKLRVKMWSTAFAQLRSPRRGEKSCIRLRVSCIYSFIWNIVLILTLFYHPLEAGSVFDDRNYTFPFTAYFREEFEKSFHSRCEKYKFVQRWVNKLENPGERYLMYVYQEAGFRNGGLGDRVGGLISATAMALRFDRQLIIKADDLFKAFRPYHPDFSAFAPVAVNSSNGSDDDDGNSERYRWTDYEQWTQYDMKTRKNNSIELGVKSCINNDEKQFKWCSMADRDVSQPYIEYRSNRAYICYYDKHPEYYGYKQMHRLGIEPTTDLYEATGCMLRLALWPTERLWRVLDRLYSDSLQRSSTIPTTATTDATTATAADTADTLSTNTNSKEEEAPTVLDTNAESTSALAILSAAAKQSAGAFQLGMHYRCGDRSFTVGSAFDDSCVWDFEKQSEYPKGFKRIGNPYMTAICARGSYQQMLSGNYSEAQCEAKSEKYRAYNIEANLLRVGKMAPTAPAEQVATVMAVVTANISEKIVLGFVASDNSAAAKQMAKVSQLPYILLPQQGCHVEMDQTTKCHLFTISSWLALALSDVLVTQTIESGAPISGFSRYAGVYGLKQMPFRDTRNCGVLYDYIDISRRLQENWIC